LESEPNQSLCAAQHLRIDPADELKAVKGIQLGCLKRSLVLKVSRFGDRRRNTPSMDGGNISPERPVIRGMSA
jgi:hypothetical protein